MSLRDPDDPNAQRYTDNFRAKLYDGPGRKAKPALTRVARALFPKQEMK